MQNENFKIENRLLAEAILGFTFLIFH